MTGFLDACDIHGILMEDRVRDTERAVWRKHF